eukprot:TRINITY_DN597_c0_g1_i6.p1 TRINITY_DN597_c0_g1~~TRINITY_DN597_c0_g1_i6.p1  ORF type:complete len:675 (+),score=91.42 TRINITY_DN597_c0_g1_i6:1085-3109(+)
MPVSLRGQGAHRARLHPHATRSDCRWGPIQAAATAPHIPSTPPRAPVVPTPKRGSPQGHATLVELHVAGKLSAADLDKLFLHVITNPEQNLGASTGRQWIASLEKDPWVSVSTKAGEFYIRSIADALQQLSVSVPILRAAPEAPAILRSALDGIHLRQQQQTAPENWVAYALYADETVVEQFKHRTMHPIYCCIWNTTPGNLEQNDAMACVGYFPETMDDLHTEARQQSMQECLRHLVTSSLPNQRLAVLLGDIPELTDFARLRIAEQSHQPCRLCLVLKKDILEGAVGAPRQFDGQEPEPFFLECGLGYFDLLPCFMHEVQLGMIKRIRNYVHHKKRMTTQQRSSLNKALNSASNHRHTTLLSGTFRNTAAALTVWLRCIRSALTAANLPIPDVLNTFCNLYRVLLKPAFSETDLEALEHHLEHFRRSIVTCPLASKLFSSRKFHHLFHYVELIRRHGPPRYWSAAPFERFHKIAAKLTFAHTNRRQYMPQVVKHMAKNKALRVARATLKKYSIKRLRNFDLQSQCPIAAFRRSGSRELFIPPPEVKVVSLTIALREAGFAEQIAYQTLPSTVVQGRRLVAGTYYGLTRFDAVTSQTGEIARLAVILAPIEGGSPILLVQLMVPVERSRSDGLPVLRQGSLKAWREEDVSQTDTHLVWSKANKWVHNLDINLK